MRDPAGDGVIRNRSLINYERKTTTAQETKEPSQRDLCGENHHYACVKHHKTLKDLQKLANLRYEASFPQAIDELL